MKRLHRACCVLARVQDAVFASDMLQALSSRSSRLLSLNATQSAIELFGDVAQTHHGGFHGNALKTASAHG
eukprot:6182409-Pleurochrysis_carterae.AAC.3